MATASAGYGGHKVAVYDPSYRVQGSVDDFEEYHNPVHVEAGASGDFYDLDNHRGQVVRFSPTGKQ